MKLGHLAIVALTACQAQRVSNVPVPAPVPVPDLVPREPPKPPKLPAYDLEADRAHRIAQAKLDLPGKLSIAVVADAFVVVGPPSHTFQASVSLMQSAMAGFLNDRFGRRPSEAITVYLLPNAAAYEALCQKKYAAPCIAHFGFYQPSDRAMVMNIGLGLGTLTHELAHPLVEENFPDAPTWLNEGIASVFEQPLIPKRGEIHGGTNWRLPRLRAGLAAREIRLDDLFTMSDEAFRADKEDLHYAAARYVCQWLDERGKLWPLYQRWRDDFAADPSGVKTFTVVVGASPEDAHGTWAKWVAAL